jgi:hypothetical protein
MTCAEASSSEEPGAGILHAGICEGAVGQPAVLPPWQRARMRRYLMPFVAMLTLVAGCGSGHVRQFAAQVKSVVNPDELQSWATNLIAKTSVTNGSSVDVRQEDIPSFVRGIYKDDPPEFVEVVTGDGGPCVLVAYGGGFGHWGLHVGYPSLVEKSDQNFYVAQWKPGIYFWNGP